MVDLIDVDGLSFAYGTAGTPAIADVDLTFEPGTFTVVAGRSGSGKSTLLRAVAGLVPRFHGGTMAGRVTVDGHDTRETPVREMARHVGTVFQDPASQIVTERVADEVTFPLENLGVEPDRGRRLTEDALAALDLGHLRDRDPRALSDGERQRLAVAAALAPEPDVLLLDEPASNLDPQGARSLVGTVARLRDDLGLTVLWADHRLDDVAPSADRLVALAEGRVVADGTPRDVLTSPVRDKAGLGRPPVLDLTDRLGVEARPLTVAEARRALDGWSAADPTPRTVPDPVVASFEEVAFAYDDHPVLDGVDAEIRRGETLGIVGPSGAGKTTLVEHLDASRHPDRGRVVVDGEPTDDRDVEAMADVVGLVPSDPGKVLLAETVRDELELSLRHRDLYGADVWIDQVLDRLGLADLADRHPDDLSGGQRQRLAVAAFAVRNPDILVLDEPTRGLDPGHRAGLAGLVEDRRRRGRTTVVVTHDADLVARTCDRVAHLAGGGLVGPLEVHDALARTRVHTTQISLLDRSMGGDGRTLTVDEVVR